MYLPKSSASSWSILPDPSPLYFSLRLNSEFTLLESRSNTYLDQLLTKAGSLPHFTLCTLLLPNLNFYFQFPISPLSFLYIWWLLALLPFIKLMIHINLPYLGDPTDYQISIQLQLKFTGCDPYYIISRDPSYPAPEHNLTVVTASGSNTVTQSATATQASESQTSKTRQRNQGTEQNTTRILRHLTNVLPLH